MTPVNDVPVAGNDAYSTNANTSLTVAASGVLVNDTDVDGDPLTALLVGGPTNGSLTLNANGSFTYTPSANFSGPVSFTYRAQDPSGAQSNVATVSIMVAAISGAAIRPGFNSNALPGNDDGSTGTVATGFMVNFFGRNYSTVSINNNGNLTFDGSMGTYTPFGLTAVNRAIIAPFFADVDTRVGNVVRYGTGTVDGRPAFGVNWPGVGCYSRNISVLNDFQVVLIDRSDLSVGSFDIEFNYNRIQWETGQASGGNAVCQGGSAARVGFSNGTSAPGTFFELPGSGVPGSFMDSNTATGLIHNSLNTPQRGRYVFPVR